MARGNFSTANYLKHSTSLITSFPVSFFCWAKPDSGASGGNFPTLMQITDTGVSNRTMTLGLDRGAVTVNAVNSWTTFQQAVSSGSYSEDVWQAMGATFTDNNNRAVFLGGTKTTDTGSSGTGIDSNADTFAIGVLERTTVDDPFEGEIAWATVWTVVLTDAEMTALANGAHPLSIQPRNIWGFWGDLHSSGNEPAWIGTDLAEQGTLPVTESPMVAYGVPRLVTRDAPAAGGANIEVIGHYYRNLLAGGRAVA